MKPATYYKKIIKDAYKKSGTENNFVASCEGFLKKHKYLSVRQVRALKKVKPYSVFIQLDDGWLYDIVHGYGD